MRKGMINHQKKDQQGARAFKPKESRHNHKIRKRISRNPVAEWKAASGADRRRLEEDAKKRVTEW